MVSLDTSIILVGMRASGKSTIGKIIAKLLNFEFIDLDVALEKQEGCSIAKIIEQHDWGGFRRLEAKLLVEQVNQHPKRTVFATGGGVIETPT